MSPNATRAAVGARCGAKGPKLTLQGVEQQVVALQQQLGTLQNKLQNFAVVNQTGTLVRGSSSVASASRIRAQTGRYQVIFNRDVSGCGYVATIFRVMRTFGIVPLGTYRVVASTEQSY